MNEEIEIWKDVVGFENLYMVSNLGRVVCLKEENCGLHRLRITESGYINTYLYSPDGNKFCGGVQILVAMTFLGHIPCGHKKVVDHINNIRHDNRLCNLQVISQRDNIIKEKNSKSGYTGVKVYGKGEFKALITLHGEHINLGTYGTAEKANEAYLKAKYLIEQGKSEDEIRSLFKVTLKVKRSERFEEKLKRMREQRDEYRIQYNKNRREYLESIKSTK